MLNPTSANSEEPVSKNFFPSSKATSAAAHDCIGVAGPGLEAEKEKLLSARLEEDNTRRALVGAQRNVRFK